MHQTQGIDTYHERQQDGHEAETAVDHELRQPCSGQTQEVADTLAVGQAVRTVQGQDRLIGGAGEKKTDIRQGGDEGKSEQQDTDDHTCLTGLKEALNGFPQVRFLHADGSFGRTLVRYTLRFR